MASDKGHQGDKQGALVRNLRGREDLFGPNQNHQNTSKKASELSDQEIIDVLQKSGMVNPKELCSWRTPDDLITQNPVVDAITQVIIEIINNMAITRRMLLYKKLTKTCSPDDVSRTETLLARWPAQVQEMHGRIAEHNGRCLQIPPCLVTDVNLHSRC